jgi:allantoinase
MTEYLIYSKRCFIDSQFVEATLHVKNEKILQIHKGIQCLENTPFLVYNNLIVMSGIIDAHVHINEPGREDWEGFDTATKAAAIGGVTTLIEIPLNASTLKTNIIEFKLKKDSSKDKLHFN